MRAALPALLLLARGAALAAQAPASTLAVPTSIDLTQPVMQGLLEVPVPTGVRVRGVVVSATATARVRSNVGWRLQVTLAEPVSPDLRARVRAGAGPWVRLDAAERSAVVAAGDGPCALCRVELEWEFTFAPAKKPRTLSPPDVRYTVLPAPLAGGATDDRGQPFLTSFAQLSRSPTIRLNTSFPGRESSGSLMK